MIIQILKAVAAGILAGILAGIAIFLIPFIILRILIVLLIIRLIFRLFGGGRRWKHAGYHFYPAFARRWEHMTDEEKKAFRDKMQSDFFNKMDSQNN